MIQYRLILSQLLVIAVVSAGFARSLSGSMSFAGSLLFDRGIPKTADRSWNFFPQERYVRRLGYEFETHKGIKTGDGYILTMFRIYRKAEYFKGQVLFMHGLLGNAELFFVNRPDRIFALLLADQGYNVWIGNNRGSYHSLGHTHLDSRVPLGGYWNYSWHEMGIYDVPAMIDHALYVGNTKDLVFIGHSEGATEYFVMASMRPSYNEKIKHMIAFGPAVFMSNAKTPFLKNVVAIYKRLQSFGLAGRQLSRIISKVFSYIEKFPAAALSRNRLQNIICQVFNNLCIVFLKLLCGPDAGELDEKRISDKLWKYYPDGSSTKQFLHYFQLYRSGTFSQYDYGSDNIWYYGTRQAPSYDLSRVTSNITFYYSGNDYVADPKDVTKLHMLLPNSKTYFLGSYNHVDFILAKDAHERLNIPLINEINEIYGYKYS